MVFSSRVKKILKNIYFSSSDENKKKMEYAYSFFPFSSVFWKYKRRLEKSQWCSKKQLEALQIRKLRTLIRHAYENVPYYRKVFASRKLKPADITAIDDLVKLPILTKEEIKNNFEDLKARNFNKFSPDLVSTSGSTGEPLSLCIDLNRQKITRAFCDRHADGAYPQWKKKALIRYCLGDNGRQEKIIEKLFYRGGAILELRISCARGNESQILGMLEDFQPDIIVATPSTLLFLAEYSKKHKLQGLSLKAILTTSEVFFPSFRRIIEEQFRCRAFDCYWNSELTAMAHECWEGNLHIDAEYGIIEFLDTKGNTVAPGRRGFIVSTQFDNFAMPLIRYNTKDIAVLSSRTCFCGRESALIDSLEGRNEEMIVTGSGGVIGKLDSEFINISGLKICQIIQTCRGKIAVKAVKDNNYSDESLAKLKETLEKQVNGELEVEIEFVAEINPTETGKFRFISSGVPVEL